jgi:hypothetical protein
LGIGFPSYCIRRKSPLQHDPKKELGFFEEVMFEQHNRASHPMAGH